MPLLPQSASDVTRYKLEQSTYRFPGSGAVLTASSLAPKISPQTSVLEPPEFRNQCFETCPLFVSGSEDRIIFEPGGSLSFTSTQEPEYGIPQTSWLVVPNDGSFAPVSGTFTIQWFQRITNAQPFPRVFSINNSYFAVSLELTDGSRAIKLYTNNTVNTLGIIVNTAMVDTWLFFTLQHQSNTFTLFLNGSFLGSVTVPFSLTDTTSPLYIGQMDLLNGETEGFDGLITNFCWTNALVSPAVPTQPIFGGASTVLLLRASTIGEAVVDSSPLSKPITNVGVSWSSTNPFL